MGDTLVPFLVAAAGMAAGRSLSSGESLVQVSLEEVADSCVGRGWGPWIVPALRRKGTEMRTLLETSEATWLESHSPCQLRVPRPASTLPVGPVCSPLGLSFPILTSEVVETSCLPRASGGTEDSAQGLAARMGAGHGAGRAGILAAFRPLLPGGESPLPGCAFPCSGLLLVDAQVIASLDSELPAGSAPPRSSVQAGPLPRPPWLAFSFLPFFFFSLLPLLVPVIFFFFSFSVLGFCTTAPARTCFFLF